ncbi:hypothetical protein [Anaerosalibacter massiliensis]|uniref:DUF340 domain-containing protein n=1 Tax=Anaerosalibacter massiliensis TaxID=1347392 RepID=A0A9X2MD72_9FIRM|nr:hypothetical protein [Anaerosalibacter massiliensis]MCR2042832.1 hypothetical protein [Anaerosalibacter massiliensis]
MNYTVLVYFLLLALGAIISHKGLISDNFSKKLGPIQNFCLLFLLFTMGVRIGLDKKVISSFFQIGAKATVLAVFSILFSIILVRLVRNMVLRDEGEVNEP